LKFVVCKLFNTAVTTHQKPVYFSFQNAPKPFGGRALCQLALKGWVPEKGKGGEGEE